MSRIAEQLPTPAPFAFLETNPPLSGLSYRGCEPNFIVADTWSTP